MKPLEKKYFAMQGEQQGALNADDAAFAIGTNQWVNMQDMRIGSTDKGETAQVEFNGGTRAIQPSYIVGDYICIGSVEDAPKRRLVRFLTGGGDFSGDIIEVYFVDDDANYLVVNETQIQGGLNFSKDYPIHSARIIGDILYWVEGENNQPRKLNIEAALKLNNPTYQTDVTPYSLPIEAGVITLIRNPPAFKLNTVESYAGGLGENYMLNFAGQFAWRFIFRDGEVSRPSDKTNLINYQDPASPRKKVILYGVGHIDQDVQQVDFLVRYGFNPQLFVIKSWNKDVPSEAAAIQAHNAGTPLQFDFYNDFTGVALDLAYSVSQQDYVPFYSETLEAGLGRLFLGNNTSSHYTPVDITLSASIQSQSGSLVTSQILKTNSQYRVGIEFLDAAKRSLGNVVTNSSCLIQVPDRDYDYTTFYTGVLVTLQNGAAPNDIPEDAYYYRIMMTKNLHTRFFIQAVVNHLIYLYRDANGELSGLPIYVAGAPPEAIGIYTIQLQNDKMGYTYDPASGDRCRIYFSVGGVVKDLKVKGQEGNYILLEPEQLTLGDNDKYIYEIYTPYIPSGDEPFYSVSNQVYTIVNPGTSLREYQFDSVLVEGDIYTRLFFNNSWIPTDTTILEYMNRNRDYWKQWLGNWGDVGINKMSKRIKKKNAIQWSETLVEGTSTNGMSTFDALNEKILPVSMGALRKLQQTSKVQQQGNVMLAIGEEETASLYLGEVQLVGSDTNSTLAYAPNVIGTVNILKGNFGTSNPESVVEYRGHVYWLDAHNGRVIQYSVNGLFPISNFKMIRFWKLWCDKFLKTSASVIEGFNCRPFVFMSVDPTHDELVISIPKLSDTPPKGYLPDYPETIYPFDPLDYQAKAMVYDIKNSRWLESFSFYAENIVSASNQLYSSNFGILNEHNQYNIPANYYGVQYTPKIMFVANQEPNKPKVFATVSVQSNLVPKLMYFYNIEPYQQCSDLVDFQFRNIEDAWTCAIMRNKLTPTAEGYNTDGLLANEPMRSVAMFVELSFDAVAPLKLRFVNIGYSLSYGNPTV